MPPLPPDTLLHQRYLIRRVIGQGGMGNVYLAEDTRLAGRLCAVKEVAHDPALPPHLLEEARAQFLQEATVLARLDHPNLPKVPDFFSEGRRDYLVMDFVPGKDLRTLIEEARYAGRFLPEKQVLAWAGQLADALTYLHSQNPPIIHRDIKPGNLKLTPGGVIKLVDFGLVKVLESDEVTVTVVQGRGTALYTPLEQYGGDTGRTDVRSDIYAFGATLYHLLTNHPPPSARDRFLNPAIFRPPRAFNPEISPRTERAILWAMRLHPDERPESVEAFREALLGGWMPNYVTAPPVPAATWADLFAAPTERALTWAAILLALAGLVLTLR